MVTKRTGNPRGRPILALRDDPDRYILAYYEAIARINANVPGVSRRGIALHIAMARHGQLVNEPENIERWRSGRGGLFQALTFRGTEGSGLPRHASAFHPIAEDFAKKAQRIGKFEGSEDDMNWWIGMVCSWIASLREPDFILAQHPILWCRLIGEFPFQQRVLARFVEARFGGRPVPSFSLPDFIPHEAD